MSRVWLGIRLLRGNEKRRQVERNFPIRGSLGTESFLQYAIIPVFAQAGSHNRQPAPEVCFDHGPNARELRGPAPAFQNNAAGSFRSPSTNGARRASAPIMWPACLRWLLLCLHFGS